MDQLDDDVQELMEATAEAFLPKVNLSKFELYSQRTFIALLQTLQRHAALNPIAQESLDFHLNLMSSPDIKRQIEENRVGWADMLLDINQTAIQFFQKLKAIVFILQIKFLEEQKFSEKKVKSLSRV